MQAEYEQTVDSQRDNSAQLARLRQQNQKLTAELKSLRETALSVESDANKSIDVLHKKNAVLKVGIASAGDIMSSSHISPSFIPCPLRSIGQNG